MGDLDVGGFDPILAALPLLVAAFAGFAMLPSSLNLLSVGADAGGVARRGRGPDAALGLRQRLAGHRRRRGAWPARSASSASSCRTWCGCWSAPTIACCCRRRRSSARRSWSCATCGARTLMAPVEIPVGVVTALIGGPFFLWLLVRNA